MAKVGIGSVLVNSVLYTFGNMLLKVFSFFLIPLYTTYLQPDQYGILNLSAGFTAVVSCITMMGLQYAVIRFYADFKDDVNKVARMFGTVNCSILLVGTILSVVLYLFKDYWEPLFFKDIDFYPVIFLSILISFVSSLYTVYQDSLKGMQQAKKSVLLTYVFFFMLLGANLLTVVGLRMGAAGILWATLFVNVVMAIVMFIDLKKHGLFTFCIDRVMLKDMLRYSLPIVPHTMSYNISTFVTRVIINNKMSVSSLGLFSFASQFGGVSDIALNSVQSAFQPWMFERLNSRSGEGANMLLDVTKTSYLLMWIYGFIYIVIGSFSQEAILLMASPHYSSAWVYVPVMVFAVALKGPLYFYNNFLYYDKSKTYFIFVTTVVSSIINIAFTWLLVPVYGIFGSIIADIIALAVRLFIVIPVVYIQAKKVYSFTKLEALSLIPMFFMLLALFPSYLQITLSMGMIILYKMGIIMLYVGVVYFIYKKEIRLYLKSFNHN